MSLNSKVAEDGRDITYFILILFSAFIYWIIQSKNMQQPYTQFYLETGLSSLVQSAIKRSIMWFSSKFSFGLFQVVVVTFFSLVTKHHDQNKLKEQFILTYDSRGLDVHNGSEDIARTGSWDIISRPHTGSRMSRKWTEDTNSQAHLLWHTSLVSFHILKEPSLSEIGLPIGTNYSKSWNYGGSFL